MGLSLEHFLPSLKVMARGTHGFWDIRATLTRVLSEEVNPTYTDIMRLSMSGVESALLYHLLPQSLNLYST